MKEDCGARVFNPWFMAQKTNLHCGWCILSVHFFLHYSWANGRSSVIQIVHFSQIVKNGSYKICGNKGNVPWNRNVI
jgi:hypothetical protein